MVWPFLRTPQWHEYDVFTFKKITTWPAIHYFCFREDFREAGFRAFFAAGGASAVATRFFLAGAGAGAGAGSLCGDGGGVGGGGGRR